MIKADIVVIDSGISEALLKKYTNRINGVHIVPLETGFIQDQLIWDSYGHGTAVANIVLSHTDASVFIIKAFENESQIDEDVLIYALSYIRENISCKIVNLSLGLKICSNKISLKKICDDLKHQGTIVVSAFDNDGCFSYPAAFDNVIGIGNSYKCRTAREYEFVEGSPVNILAKGGLQRVLWNERNIVLGGSSFACAYMTAIISNMLHNQHLSVNQILDLLRCNATFIHKYKQYEKKADKYFTIKNAAIFPLNKEIRSLLNFIEDLDFTITEILDIKQSGHVGAKLESFVSLANSQYKDLIVEDILSFDFSNSVDTIIVGHMDEINRMLKYDLRLEIVKRAVDKKVNVFSFDSLEYCIDQFCDRQSQIYYPIVTLADVPQNTFGKLYVIDKPVIAVMGTSSQQGKFSLQMLLTKMFQERKYEVGTLGTEPHALLFGMNYVYPMGYNSSLFIDGQASIILLNSLINSICDNGAEIIIAGSQANTVPTNIFNVASFPTKQHSFLLGIQPDVVILCTNPDDDLHYIENTIKYTEGITDCKVLATVIFPLITSQNWKGIFNEKESLPLASLQKRKQEMSLKLGLPSFILGEKQEMESLADLIIDYFAFNGEEDATKEI